jgi:hypothetical protein
MYEKGVKKRLNEYRARTTRQKYAKKVPYQEFRQQIYVCCVLFIPFNFALNLLTGSAKSQVGHSSHH